MTSVYEIKHRIFNRRVTFRLFLHRNLIHSFITRFISSKINVQTTNHFPHCECLIVQNNLSPVLAINQVVPYSHQSCAFLRTAILKTAAAIYRGNIDII